MAIFDYSPEILTPKVLTGLHDAMRWGYLVRNVAEAADPPAARTP
jgi:hypothetical protein